MITLEDLARMAPLEGPCLTIIQPLRDEYSQVTKPETRVAAALREAERLLREEAKLNEEERTAMLRPFRKILRNLDWKGRTGSLLLFRARDYARAAFVPESLEARVRMGNEFLILPLLPALSVPRSYWLLALSLKGVKLFRGSGDDLRAVELPPRVARGLAEFGDFEIPDHNLEARSAAGPSSGRMRAVRFGTSKSHETRRAKLHDFFRGVDRAIAPILSLEPLPLILAAVGEEMAIYRGVNTWPELLADGIHGNPDALGVSELLEKSARILEGYGEARTLRACKEMNDAAGRGLLLEETMGILREARDGRVRRLFVNSHIGQADEAAINGAAIEVLRHSGTVGVVPNLPGTAAALLRYREPAAMAPPELVGMHAS
jgi:hypothetical protein